MITSNYHTHSTYCDGKNSLEEMVLSAISKGFTEIGFSGHAPTIRRYAWESKFEKLARYKAEVNSLKEKYADKIKIFLGLEMDYYSPVELADGCDYTIGSVHIIKKGDDFLEIDNSKQIQIDDVNKYYNGDFYAYVEDYYALVAEIVAQTKCDIIGHFDLVTKFNELGDLFDIKHTRYQNAMQSALEALIKTRVPFEINTGAISRGYRTSSYPEQSILDRIGNAGIPFVINSDTHNVNTIDCNLTLEQERLDKLGYKYLTTLKDIKQYISSL